MTPNYFQMTIFSKNLLILTFCLNWHLSCKCAEDSDADASATNESISNSGDPYADLGTVEVPFSLTSISRPQIIDFDTLEVGTVTEANYFEDEQKVVLEVVNNQILLVPKNFVDSQLEIFLTNDAGLQYKFITTPFTHLSEVVELAPSLSTISTPLLGLYPNNPLHAPTVSIVDGDYLYISAWRAIYRMNLSDGRTEPFIGVSGQPGTADGTREEARINLSDGMLRFGEYIYFTDPNAHVLRRVGVDPNEDSFDIVETVAGSVGVSGSADGIGIAASFFNPRGICTDGTSIFIADGSNLLLRRYNPATDNVDTIVSTGFSGSLYGCAVHLPNHIYVTSGSTIVRVNLSGFSTSTYLNSSFISGTEIGIDAASTKSPLINGLSIDGDDLYYWSRVSHVLNKVDLSTDIVTPVAGSPMELGDAIGHATSETRLCEPSGVSIDGQKIFISNRRSEGVDVLDTSTSNVSRVVGRTPGSVTTYCTDGARVSEGGDLHLDGSKLYFTALNEQVLREYDIVTGSVSTVAGEIGSTGNDVGIGSKFFNPRGVTSNATHLFVVDRNNHRILSFDKSTYNSTVLAGSGTPGSADGLGAGASFRYPTGICRLGTKLYVADTDNYTIREVDIATGNVTLVAGQNSISGFGDHVTATSASFSLFSNLYCDSAGSRVIVADKNNHAIRIFTPGGGVSTLSGLSGIAGTANGNLALASFNLPDSVTMVGDDIFVTSVKEKTVRRINEASDIVEDFIAGNINNTPAHRNSFQVASSFITSSATHLYTHPSSLIVQTDLSTGDSQFIVGKDSNMTSVTIKGIKDGKGFETGKPRIGAIASDGEFVYTAERDGLIKKRSFDGDVVETVGGTLHEFGSTDERFTWANDMVYYENALYVSESTNHTVRKLDLATKKFTIVAGAIGISGSADGDGGAARFNTPTKMALHQGSLLVADSKNYLVRKISLESGDFGSVETIAGQVGVNAEALGALGVNSFSSINCLTSDGQTIYVCQNDSILRLDSVSKVLSAGWGVEGVVDEYAIGSRENTRFSLIKDIEIYNGSMVVLDEGRKYIVDLETGNSSWLQISKSGDLSDFVYDEVEYLHNFKFTHMTYIQGVGLLLGQNFSLVLVK